MKYIVDIDDFEPLFKVDSIGVFGIGKSVSDSDNDHSWSRIKSIEEFEQLNSDYINEHFGDLQDTAYKKGLHDGESKCRYCNEYQRGFEDGKAVNDKGCEGCKYAEMGSDTTICAQCCNAYYNQWKSNDDKIVVGDEVVDKNGYKTIVTYIYGDLFDGLCSDGSTMTNLFLDDNHKTGRHFDIDKFLDEIKGEDDK